MGGGAKGCRTPGSSPDERDEKREKAAGGIGGKFGCSRNGSSMKIGTLIISRVLLQEESSSSPFPLSLEGLK